FYIGALHSSMSDPKVLKIFTSQADAPLVAQTEKELTAREKWDVLFTSLCACLSVGGMAYVFFLNRKLEQALRKERMAYERLAFFDQLTEETILVHDHGIIVDVNESITKLLGYSREEMVGRHVTDFMDHETGQQTLDRIDQGYPEASYEIAA